jgi:hypothetical protein
MEKVVSCVAQPVNDGQLKDALQETAVKQS